jgi:hypothetical protein
MRSRKKRMEDIRVAKDQKMKKVAIGLGVVFVAVLAFEVLPMVMHKGGGSAAAASTATTTSTPAPTTGTPAQATTGSAAPATTPAGTTAAAVAPTATSTKLTNSDQAPNVGKAQLFSFSQFTGRDPFAQQINTATAGPLQTGSSTTSSSSPTASTGTTAAAGTTAAVTRHQPTRTLAVTGAARISVNGRVQVVRVGGSFPSANPLFRLVSVTNGVAKIGIASGSYSSGAKAVSLRAGRSLTLVDTADGIRYQIRLVS